MISLAALLLLTTSCILDIKYEALPFNGKVLHRITGYNGESLNGGGPQNQITNDRMFFNLKEGEQKDVKDWDFAVCGYHFRTNGGTSGNGMGAAADLGFGNYDAWTSVSQIPSDIEWVCDTDKDVYVTVSMNDWIRYLNLMV